MSKDTRRSTQERRKTAPYDKLGWVRNAAEQAHRQVVGRLSPRHTKDALKLAEHHAKARAESETDEEFDHETALLGMSADLFVEHPKDVARMLVTADWDNAAKEFLSLTPRPKVLQLLETMNGVPKTQLGKGMLPLTVVMALYSVQHLIPGVCELPVIYFDLTRNSISNWMINNNVQRNKYGTCSITGNENVPTTFAVRRTDGEIVEVDAGIVTQSSAWKEAKVIETVHVKQIGMPILSKCPVCVLRRSHRPTEDDPNVPAFPFTDAYCNAKSDILQIGNPVDTGSLVMTMAYLKVVMNRDGTIRREVRRQCPACMAVAIKDPAGYLAYITETQVNRGRGPVTPEMVSAWRAEQQDAANIEHASKQQAIAAAKREKQAAMEERLEGRQSTNKLLALAVVMEKDSPGFLNEFCVFKTSDTGRMTASLVKGVKASSLRSVLDAFGALEEGSE